MQTLLDEAADWAASLTLEAIPVDVRRLAVAQAISAAGARAAARRHPVGRKLEDLLRGEGWADLAAADALLTMALDFDETAFAGHLGHAATAAALRAAEVYGADGERAVVAMVAASEVAARLTASVTLGRARGQTASHTHAAAATVAAGVIMDLAPQQLATALSLALAQPRQVLLPAFMASDAKFWVAAAPILDAGRAIDQALQGATGMGAVIETTGGFFDVLAEVPVRQAFAAYGERWHLRTLSIKAVPGCAYLGAAVEAAAGLGPIAPGEIASVGVAASIFTLGMEAESAPFIDGPASPLPALAFSTAYNVAAALLGGGLDVEDLHGPRLDSREPWRVAALTRVEHDAALSLSALAATAPVGAALAWAGEAALPYLTARGASAELAGRVLQQARTENDGTLEGCSKRVGARLRVTLRDGTVLESAREAAGGSCQETVEARVELATEKLRAQLLALSMDPVDVDARVASHLCIETLESAPLAALVAAG